MLNGNGVAPAQTGTGPEDVTVTGTISVAEASSVLDTTYDISDAAAIVAAAMNAGDAEVNGAQIDHHDSRWRGCDLSFAEADALLNGNGVAPMQTGSVAADVTVTGTISVAEASSVLGATYDISDAAETVAAAMIAEDASGVNGANSITTTNDGTTVDLSFAEADALLNGTADARQTGTDPEDVTVTGRHQRVSGIERAWCDLRHPR